MNAKEANEAVTEAYRRWVAAGTPDQGHPIRDEYDRARWTRDAAEARERSR